MRDEALKIQNQYSEMGILDEQNCVIKNLLKLHTELFEECLRKVYTQG